MFKPLIAIVGRPNVGKSTLFNRLVGRRVAVVSEISGTTRDRIVLDAVWDDRSVTLVDTGGLEPEPQTSLSEQVREQVETAIETADAIIFLADVRDGVTSVDMDIAEELRRTAKPVVLAASKADNESMSMGAVDFYSLGFGDPLPVSVHHNIGIDRLMTNVLRELPRAEVSDEEEGDVLALAIVGRVNVGKSALLNAILGEQRTIVSELPGTTRDAIDTSMLYKGQRFRLIDTAGIRRRGRIERGIEKYSVLRSTTAIERSHVALIVLDASDLVAAQDMHIAGQVAGAYRGCVLVANKWDLASKAGLDQADILAWLRERFKFMPYAPIRFVSAVHGSNVSSLLDTSVVVYKQSYTWIDPAKLRSVVWDAMAGHQPPSRGKRTLRLSRVVQEDVGPPTIAFYVNAPDLVHFSYRRYLENKLRNELGFRYTHLKLVFKSRRGA